MTRDEFASLPPMLALGLIYDVASQRLRDLPMPQVPKPPLYDGRLSRGEKGFTWMSEMTLRDLEWWENAKRKKIEEGGQYVEQNTKSAATLAKWIAWRQLFPSELWSGKRGDERATAAPPSRDPKMNAWEPRAGGTKKNAKPAHTGPDPFRGEEEESNEF